MAFLAGLLGTGAGAAGAAGAADAAAGGAAGTAAGSAGAASAAAPSLLSTGTGAAPAAATASGLPAFAGPSSLTGPAGSTGLGQTGIGPTAPPVSSALGTPDPSAIPGITPQPFQTPYAGPVGTPYPGGPAGPTPATPTGGGASFLHTLLSGAVNGQSISHMIGQHVLNGMSDGIMKSLMQAALQNPQMTRPRPFLRSPLQDGGLGNMGQ